VPRGFDTFPPDADARPAERIDATAGAAISLVPGPRDLSQEIAAELPRLRRHARALLFSRTEADDLVQDCMVAALDNQGSLKDRSRLRGWLFGVLHKQFLMRLRSDARRGAAVPIDDVAETLAASAPAADRSMVHDLVRAMAELTPEHRELLLLVNVEGQSYQQAADTLGVPIGTVMSRLARARHRLRTLLEQGTGQRASSKR